MTVSFELADLARNICKVTSAQDDDSVSFDENVLNNVALIGHDTGP